ncbi:helix-turn-helix transcriptional regulator [Aminivibrio sp.]
MKDNRKSWNEVKNEMLGDPETGSAYNDLEEEYVLIASIMRARLEKGLSQAELAARMGTTQGNISRLESGRYNPSVKFLQRVARALEKELEVTLK